MDGTLRRQIFDILAEGYIFRNPITSDVRSENECLTMLWKNIYIATTENAIGMEIYTNIENIIS